MEDNWLCANAQQDLNDNFDDYVDDEESSLDSMELMDFDPNFELHSEDDL